MSAPIRIKFVSKTQPDQVDDLWRPLLPSGTNQIGACRFSFDVDDRDYDFLVAYEDLSPLPGSSKVLRSEPLACAPINTMLLTTEPASIRIDGPHYLRQFGHIWTNKHPSLVRHPRQIRETPPLRFFYGRNLAGGAHLPVPEDPPPKSADLSAMSSTKAMVHTVHARRLAFFTELKAELGDSLNLFGRGIQPVDDKAEAMSSYRYHIAVENHVEPGHFTEKLTDCFVAGCLPFYFGDPNFTKVFPTDAVIPIDIFDVPATAQIIRDSIATDQFEARRSAILEARATTLHRFNTLRAVADRVEKVYTSNAVSRGVIHGRHAFRKAHPFKAAQDAFFVAQLRRSPHTHPVQTVVED